MKFNKLFVSSLILTNCLSIGFISSCSNGKTWADNTEENEHTTFIKNRTFSIKGAQTIGTAWIIGEATPNNANDYCYYMATNMHVIRPMNQKGDYTLSYADYTDLDQYTQFAEVNYDLLKQIDSDSRFVYGTTSTSFYEPGIDFVYFIVNFGQAKNIPTKIKAKLDSLNQYYATNGYICKFPEISESSEINNKKKYVGGYPYNNSTKKAYWECHSLDSDQLVFKPFEEQYTKGQKGHSIGTPDKDQNGKTITYEEGTVTENFYRYDVSPQYYSQAKWTTKYLKGGASGSMLIDEDNNTIGIYWGGWELSENEFYPSYSLFKTPNKNFLPNKI